jgi:hypothetical protein
VNGIPSAGHPHVASAGLVAWTTSNVNGHAEQNRKRKSVLTDENALVDGSHQTQASIHPISNQHAPIKSKSSADGNPYFTERDSISKSFDPSFEKKRSKNKYRDSCSDGGSVHFSCLLFHLELIYHLHICFSICCIHVSLLSYFLNLLQETLWKDPRSTQK